MGLILGSVLDCAENKGKYALAYLDPPYNTGSQFCYADRMSRRSWRFWFERVASACAQAMLPGGVICVSIDDHEQHTVRSVLDEIFDFEATIIVENNPVGRHLGSGFAGTHEYLHVYTHQGRGQLVPDTPEMVNLADYPLEGPDGKRYRMLPLTRSNRRFNKHTRPTMYFPIIMDGVEYWPQNDKSWRWSKSKVDLEKHKLHVHRGQICERQDWSPERRSKLRSVWTSEEIGSTTEAVKEMEKCFGARVFETPKPSRLLKRIAKLVAQPGPILDGFCGSGAMLQACKDLGYECDSYQISEELDASAGHHQELIRWCDSHGMPRDVQSLARWRFRA